MTTDGTGAGPGAPLRVVHGPRWAFLQNRIVNPLMRSFLGSRFHGLMGTSDTLMILTFRGRKSGATYSLPTGYLQDGFHLVSYTPFRWWVNLRGGAPVSVTLRGRKLQGTAEVCTDPATVAAGMDVYLRHNPGDAMFWKIRVDKDKVPNAEDVARAAPNNVQILVTLAAENR